MFIQQILKRSIKDVRQTNCFFFTTSTSLLEEDKKTSKEVIKNVKYANVLETSATTKTPVCLNEDSSNEIIELSGVPAEHQNTRKARIFMPARNPSQTAWKNTNMWKIELDNRERWENQTIGWSSSGDPLSNISMALSFASKENAIAFCQKNNWQYEIEKPHQRKILPKSYSANFSWNNRTRVTTK